jgi:hypothetical protein
MAKKPLVARSEKEAALEAMKTAMKLTEAESEKESHRYNIEIPSDFFEEIREFIKENGYNLKGFFLTAAKEKIKRERQNL